MKLGWAIHRVFRTEVLESVCNEAPSALFQVSYTAMYRVEELAKTKGVSMAQISLMWNLEKTTAPIIGTTSLSNLEDLLGEWCFVIKVIRIELANNDAGALDVKLTAEEMKYLEEPYEPIPIAGHK